MVSCSLEASSHLLQDVAMCLVRDLQCAVLCDSREALLWGKIMIKSV